MSDANPRRKPRQARSQAMVDAILEATARLLVEVGYDKASTNRIAKRAGVSVGSLYQYFPNKQALVASLAERHVGAQLEMVTRALAEKADAPIEALCREVIAALIAAQQIDPALQRVLIEQAPVDTIEGMLRQAEAALQAHIIARRGDEIPDPEIAAFLVVRLVDSAICAAVLRRPELLEDERLTEGLVDMILRYALFEAPDPALP